MLDGSTTVRYALPKRDVGAVGVRHDSVAIPHFENPGGKGSPSFGVGPPKKRILVVDDNEDAAWLLAQLLRGLGHEVQTALDGATGIQVLERFAPQAALLDIGLPVMDGLELARHIRARVPEIFLIAVTGYGQAADREASRAAGFDAHLVKPVDIDQVSRLLTMGRAASASPVSE